LSLRWVPSTSEAPIETFISWPSGMLSAALLGVLLPAAEELFFRGYLYAALLPLGRAAAAIVSVLVFGSMHAVQSWGNWGGLAAVFAAGATLCAVRVISGSTLIAALVHVAYNLTLSLASIAASLRYA
jgi:membrane protease YdiL (CAAX protease family)